MRFTDTFIKRPVLAISLSFLIALLGFQAIFKMQVREYPEVINTVITVSTSYYGASADLIQGFITQPLEQAVAQADNIDFMTSSSQLGSSTVTAYMKLNTDPNRHPGQGQLGALPAAERGGRPLGHLLHRLHHGGDLHGLHQP
jgi:multidrug efflux pump